MMTIADVNALAPVDFVARFGDVAEHSPWVAREAFAQRPFEERVAVVEAFATALKSANPDAQRALIRAHPDLATKARLTEDSSREQAGAGLAALSEEELASFTTLNAAYKSKFGFPFIFAVKGATKQMILAAFEERISHSPEAEFATAIAQICRIFRFRIEDRVAA
ncbi:MAG: 2-oxo-4-hydroxy-4-carboxy-5-ureidoimidazoline decarboxylase [Alphaproteobacteria bacterium]|nr:2-oxo-4-hydroxy-4-carboxy-5-ureidoimidazoline decarboxylase [Alphaproteobacteria bacterium]